MSPCSPQYLKREQHICDLKYLWDEQSRETHSGNVTGGTVIQVDLRIGTEGKVCINAPGNNQAFRGTACAGIWALSSEAL